MLQDWVGNKRKTTSWEECTELLETRNVCFRGILHRILGGRRFRKLMRERLGELIIFGGPHTRWRRILESSLLTMGRWNFRRMEDPLLGAGKK